METFNGFCSVLSFSFLQIFWCAVRIICGTHYSRLMFFSEVLENTLPIVCTRDIIISILLIWLLCVVMNNDIN